MEEIVETIETIEVKSTKYVVMSIDKYETLNHQISEAMGFDVGLPTERYAPVVPMLAKVNIQFTDVGDEMVETYDTIPVMQITATVQDSYPNLLVGYELIESYTPYVYENVQL